MLMFCQQSLEKQRTAEKERLFLVYAKQWWREFLDIRQSNHSKIVKIFAQVRPSKMYSSLLQNARQYSINIQLTV